MLFKWRWRNAAGLGCLPYCRHLFYITVLLACFVRKDTGLIKCLITCSKRTNLKRRLESLPCDSFSLAFLFRKVCVGAVIVICVFSHFLHVLADPHLTPHVFKQKM